MYLILDYAGDLPMRKTIGLYNTRAVVKNGRVKLKIISVFQNNIHLFEVNIAMCPGLGIALRTRHIIQFSRCYYRV